MNKKQYFIFVWILCSIAPILLCLSNIKRAQQNPTHILVMFGYLWTIIASGIALTFGLDFGERIGIKFLLWKDENFNWSKDIIVPSLVISIIYLVYLFFGGLWVYGNPTLFLPFQMNLLPSFPFIFYIFNAMVGLLFYLSIIVILLKKVSKDTAYSSLIPIGITFLSLFIMIIQWQSGRCSQNMFCVEIVIIPLTFLLILWKKSFETLLLTGFIMALIAYFAEPTMLLLKR